MRSLFLSAFLVCTALPLAPTTAQAQAQRYELSGNELKVPGPVVFETGSDRIKPESEGVLAHVKGYLTDKSYISLLRIEVHTDNAGAPAANQALSERRALAVAKALIARGVECKRLIAVGFGAQKPVAGNGTPDGRAQNRRVTFANAALRGRAIGGMPVDGGGRVAGDVCK